jgi:hypothetical protein
MNQSVHSNDNPAIAVSEVITTEVEIVKIPVPEVGGRDGPEPTRFGDWEKNGRCIDF